MNSNALVYLSSVPTGDAPEGMFARVLKHNVSGVRYYGAPTLTKRSSKAAETARANRKRYNGPTTLKACGLARDHVAKQKGRAA
jgi:hypothetical protein